MNLMRSIAIVIVGFHAALLDAAADRPQTCRLPADYLRIAALNPFDLTRSSPPHSVSPGTVSTNPPPDLRLSGITSSTLKRLAYFVQNERSNSPQCFTLIEGQKNHDVELLAIDLPAENVKVRCGSTEFTMSLKNATLKLSGAASALAFRGPAERQRAITTAESVTREVLTRPFPPVK